MKVIQFLSPLWLLRSILVVLMLVPWVAPVAVASPDLPGTAARLESASLTLAADARRVRAPGNVIASAEKLAARAGQLQDMLRSSRSSAHVRLRFADVTRHFERLGETLARMNPGSANAISAQISEVASLYAQLDYLFHGDRSYADVFYGPQLFVIVPPATDGGYVRNPDLGLSPRGSSDSDAPRPPGQHGGQQDSPGDGRLRANQGYYRLRP